MEKLVLHGSVADDGKLKVFLRDRVDEWARMNIGRDVKLTLEIRRHNRSNKQNAYYWGVVVPLVQEGIKELGHWLTTEETHDYLKKEFNPAEMELENGHCLMVPGSTTDMSTVDFMAYLEKIQFFAANMLGVPIPDPQSQTEIKFDQQ